MKTTGIIFYIFASLNFLAAIIALANNATDAAMLKMNATLLLSVLGSLFYFKGKKKESKREEEKRKAEQQRELERKDKMLDE